MFQTASTHIVRLTAARSGGHTLQERVAAMGNALRLVMTCWLMGGLWHGVCQPGSSQTAPDPTVYESFFQQVVHFAELQNSLGVVSINGQPTDLRQYKLQDAIGLTDQEARVLSTVASDCGAKVRSFYDAAGPSIFDARVRLVESKSDPQATQQLKELDDEHQQIVLAHVQQLKAAFGDSRFNTLDAFVRSGKQLLSFLPLPKAAARK